MTRFAIAAAMIIASSAAFAGDTYDFQIGGRSVHIEQPRDCNSASCVSVSIPGVYEYNTRRSQKPAAKAQPAETPVAAPATRDKAPAISAAPSPAAPTASLEPANGTSPLAAPTPAQEMPRASKAPAGLAPPLVASAPSLSPIETGVTPSPLGLWLTEEKEGKVRIEACGNNLCGYSINDKTGQNGDKVLVDMKQTGAKWSGRIHDPKGGSTYESTIALKGTDRLRVQGCAFGGMMCGGQTWTRAN